VESKQDILRRLPAVDELLHLEPLADLQKIHPRGLIVNAVRQELENARRAVLTGQREALLPERNELVRRIVKRVQEQARSSLRRVINGTGVIVHTNLGRSLLAESAVKLMVEVSRNYSNLEFDLSEGERGSRYSHVEGILKELTKAEAALVVNNNAAAVYLALQTHAQGKEVIVSRGELVEIGGSFRIPDVMARSGAILVEVGTTNKTRLSDYELAITPQTQIILKVHKSNFEILGFTEEVPLAELAALGNRRGIMVMEDLGSGCFVDLSKYGLKHEPTVQETLAAGADLVTFSGDKLLGGPQAGLILGKARYVDPIKKNPLNRAFRIDKLTLAALEATLQLYRREEEAMEKIPTLAMLNAPLQALKSRARRLAARLHRVSEGRLHLEILPGNSRVGGGALPIQTLPTFMVALACSAMSAAKLEERLRNNDPPIISRIEQEKVLLDVRTIKDDEIPAIERALWSILK
jgi:L-seryl-tRNA(Ser) seleniumtransferase